MEPTVTADQGNPQASRQPEKREGSTIDIAQLRKEYMALKATRSNVEQAWDQIEKYFMPLGTGTHPYTPIMEGAVEWKRPEVWDSTAIDATNKLSANIHGSITSPAIRWFKLAWRDEALAADAQACAWLDKVGDQIHNTLQDSDFNSEIASADQDLVTFGNSFVVEEAADADEWKGVDFEAVPIREAYFTTDSKGGVFRFFRKLYWSNVQVFDKFELDTPEHIREAAEKGEKVDERHEVVFAIYRRPDVERELRARADRNREKAKKREEAQKRKQQAAAAGKEYQDEPVPSDEITYPLAPLQRPVGCCYFLAEGPVQLGKELGYYEMPVVFARWAKTSGSIWGHGPCNILLPTVIYLNHLLESIHLAAAKVIDPPMKTTERGLMSDLDLSPGGLTVTSAMDNLAPLLPPASQGRFDVSEHLLEDIRRMIREGLHNDELQLKDSPAMTATEVQTRYELMNRVLGSTLARIETDQLSPIVKVTLGHLQRAGQLPDMPESVRQRYGNNQADFDVEYQGPLARSQRTDEVAAIERVLSFAAALLKMGIPLDVVMATIDVVAAIREVAQRLGTPADLLKPQKDVEAALNQMQEAQTRAQQAALAKTEGDAAMAHASAMATARGAAAGGAAGLTQSMPAMPTPVVAPTFNPTQAPSPGQS